MMQSAVLRLRWMMIIPYIMQSSKRVRRYICRRRGAGVCAGRDIMVSGSAYSRIGRQKRYLKAFISQAKKTLAQNPALAVNLMSQLSDYMLTDISTDEVLYLSTELSGCNFDEENMQILQGNIQMGEQYEEYYLDDEAVQQTIIDLFYEEQKK